MKVIIQNRHYFTTSLLTSESKCNFRATNPVLNCNLLCLNELQILVALMDLDIYMALQFISRVATAWSQCHPYPRVGSLQETFQPAWQQPSLDWCCEGRLVKSVIDD